jgi:hypothetical protein
MQCDNPLWRRRESRRVEKDSALGALDLTEGYRMGEDMSLRCAVVGPSQQLGGKR